MTQVLSTRALNRAMLARQLLLCRVHKPVLDTIEHLVGMQAQEPHAPYVGLWSRLVDFQPDALAQLLLDREAVRMGVMRSTLHLLSARDALALYPVVQGTRRRMLETTQFFKAIADVDIDALVAAGRKMLEEQPSTRAELTRRLRPLWPDHDASALSLSVAYLLPLVHVPPRGIWGKTGPARLCPADVWLGQPVSEDEAPQSMILRYLAAFGPATTSDIRAWSYMRGVREAIEPLRPQLRTFRDERGRELFDVVDGLLPDPDVPAPPRFLPEFDNVLVAYEERSRVIPERHLRHMNMTLGRPPLLIDGCVRAQWSIVRDNQRGAATLRIALLEPITEAERAPVEAEGLRLLGFAAADAPAHAIEFVEA